jgi:Zn-dependent protease with chaperone function
MAANIQPIFPASPVIGIATLTSATAITSRANITGTTGLVQLTPTSTNGKRVDSIIVKSKATSVASIISIWIYNGTTSFLYDEIDVTAVTASTTVDSFSVRKTYSDLILPPTYQLYISQTVQTDVNVYANGGDY